MNQNSTRTETARRRPLLAALMKYGVPLIVSVGLCYVLFHDMDFGEMVDFVRRDCDFGWIALSAVIGILCVLFRALRWRIQLRASGIDAPVMPVVYSIIGTYAVNLVLPRLGELWRSEYIARRQRAPFATVFGSMIAERASDTLVVLLMTIAAFLLGGSVLKAFIESKVDHDGILYRLIASPWTYAAATVAVALTAIFFRYSKNNRFAQKIRALWQQLAEGFMSIFHMDGAGWWLLLTACLWTCYFLQMWACFEAFGLTRHITAQHGVIVVFICYVLGSISMGVPSNGGIGPYQIAVVFGLQCFVPDINAQQGYSFANVVLGAQTLMFIILGIISFALIAADNRRLSRLQPDSSPREPSAEA